MSDDKKVIFSMVGVSKTTPQGKLIIKNIYLSFFYGAKIGIIGANGSGKSTVMKIIAGLDKAYQGDVVFSSLSMQNLYASNISTKTFITFSVSIILVLIFAL